MSTNPLVDLPLIILGSLLLLAVVVCGAAWSRRGERLGWLVRAGMVMLLAAIALRPGLGEKPVVPTRTADMEIVVVVDRTTSMSAGDWGPRQEPRLAGARSDLAELVRALPTGRFTLVTSGRRLSTEMPSTQDDRVITDSVDLLRPESATSGLGSRIDQPLAALSDLLVTVRERSPRRPRLVVLMGDGESTAAGPQASFGPLASLLDAGLVLGYGTAAGARMPLDEERPDLGWVEDASGAAAVSRLDEDNLTAVAAQMGVPYLHRTAPGGLAEIAADWRERFQEPDPAYRGAEVPVAHDLYWAFALLLFVLALTDVRRYWRRVLAARRSLP